MDTVIIALWNIIGSNGQYSIVGNDDRNGSTIGKQCGDYV
jgi:hypothetical protein